MIYSDSSLRRLLPNESKRGSIRNWIRKGIVAMLGLVSARFVWRALRMFLVTWLLSRKLQDLAPFLKKTIMT